MVHCGADCRLALVAAGTGNDFAKSVAVPARDYDATARLAVDGPDRRVDVGRIENRHFLNCVGFGFDVAVLESAANARWLKGSLVYAYAALGQLLRYRSIELAGAIMLPRQNGCCLSSPTAGGLAAHFRSRHTRRVRTACSTRWLSRTRRRSAAYNYSSTRSAGRTFGLPAVEMRQARSFSLTFRSPPAYQVDGEYRQASRSALDIECLPRALRVVG
jgi:diacylglycerol kinase family enzyme